MSLVNKPMYYILIIIIVIGTAMIVVPEKLHYIYLLILIGGVFRMVTLFEYYIRILETGIKLKDGNEEEVDPEQCP